PYSANAQRPGSPPGRCDILGEREDSLGKHSLLTFLMSFYTEIFAESFHHRLKDIPHREKQCRRSGYPPQ
ncbi:MAG: hypothetical protein WAV84_00835, partial [Bacteroidota bacterium]